jgi:hypothetical protein
MPSDSFPALTEDRHQSNQGDIRTVQDHQWKKYRINVSAKSRKASLLLSKGNKGKKKKRTRTGARGMYELHLPLPAHK